MSRTASLSLALLLFAGCQDRHADVAPGFDLVVISDSNAVGPGAWPHLIRSSLEDRSGTIPIRVSVNALPGRTLTVDRGGPATTAILGIRYWLDEARSQSDGIIDSVVLCLGTNDAQTRFSEIFEDLPKLESRIHGVLSALRESLPDAHILIASPPPICDPRSVERKTSKDNDLRWVGSSARLRAIEDALRQASISVGVQFAELASEYAIDPCMATGRDGVHLNDAGHAEVARIVKNRLLSEAGAIRINNQ